MVDSEHGRGINMLSKLGRTPKENLFSAAFFAECALVLLTPTAALVILLASQDLPRVAFIASALGALSLTLLTPLIPGRLRRLVLLREEEAEQGRHRLAK